jgi:spore coat polysaccharide biosynthesis protein SpsF
MPEPARIGVIIQARMGSSRLPGKVLRPLAGEPLLGYVVDRAARSRRAGPVVVATSLEPEDDLIELFCIEREVACFRGERENVARRFLGVMKHYGLTAFVRICGDSPLIDPGLIDHAVRLFTTGGHEIVTNILQRTFPRGESVEVINGRTFRRGYMRMRDPEQLEHVTRYFYANASAFDIHNFTYASDMSDVSLAVDTADDLQRVEEIISRMERPHWEYGLGDILADLCVASR